MKISGRMWIVLMVLLGLVLYHFFGIFLGVSLTFFIAANVWSITTARKIMGKDIPNRWYRSDLYLDPKLISKVDGNNPNLLRWLGTSEETCKNLDHNLSPLIAGIKPAIFESVTVEAGNYHEYWVLVTNGLN
jgi:hypothetical protein